MTTPIRRYHTHRRAFNPGPTPLLPVSRLAVCRFNLHTAMPLWPLPQGPVVALILALVPGARSLAPPGSVALPPPRQDSISPPPSPPSLPPAPPSAFAALSSLVADAIAKSDAKRLLSNDGASSGWTAWADEGAAGRLGSCVDRLCLRVPVSAPRCDPFGVGCVSEGRARRFNQPRREPHRSMISYETQSSHALCFDFPNHHHNHFAGGSI